MLNEHRLTLLILLMLYNALLYFCIKILINLVAFKVFMLATKIDRFRQIETCRFLCLVSDNTEKARILISHRLSNVSAADHIYVMDKGAVTEHETHEQ